jgi:hypothetical protein
MDFQQADLFLTDMTQATTGGYNSVASYYKWKNEMTNGGGNDDDNHKWQ